MQNMHLQQLGEEWHRLTLTAASVHQRKQNMRLEVEPLFSAIIPRINRELAEKGVDYKLREESQFAGYTATGPILFSPHPVSLAPFRLGSKHWTLDSGRAQELTDLVRETQAFTEFAMLFPDIQVTIEPNYRGGDRRLPSIASMLRRKAAKASTCA